jgi:hypothetical protein
MKKRLVALFAALAAIPPLTATAAVPLVVGLIGTGLGIAGIAGFSIYRTYSPTNMADAQRFFSSCWSCGMFSDIMRTMSRLLPEIYATIGQVTIPIMLALAAVWIAWNVLASWIGAKKAMQVDMAKESGAWTLAGKFSVLLVRVAIVAGLLVMPLPRIITTAFVEPVFIMGMSISNAAAKEFSAPENRYAFEACLIATAISEQMDSGVNSRGVFSPRLRHSMTCQLGAVHRLTGIGMTAGWTMLSESFNAANMHKFLWHIPIFPNVAMFLAGALIMFLFFTALVPIPLYFLETFIKLSLDLVMLPLFLLGWVFEGWKLMPPGGKNIKETFDDLIRNVVGIASVGVLVVFAIMFLDAVFGNSLVAALGDNDPRYLIAGLTLENTSLITIIMAGVFVAFFMTSIPIIIKQLFQKVEIPTKYYDKAKDDIKTVWGNIQKKYQSLQK